MENFMKHIFKKDDICYVKERQGSDCRVVKVKIYKVITLDDDDVIYGVKRTTLNGVKVIYYCKECVYNTASEAIKDLSNAQEFGLDISFQEVDDTEAK